ncbi:MAG: GNAT family N-acetyltransferase [Patescibacteria group bacterium]
MKEITFTRFNPLNNSLILKTRLVECYREVFATGPWHELMKCPICNKNWGSDQEAELAELKFFHCNVPMIPFWPQHEVLADIEKEITPEASCWLALDGEKVIGFCWGYKIRLLILEKKTGIPLQNYCHCRMNNMVNNFVAYQDEVGIISAYRGLKIAKKLAYLNFKDLQDKGLQNIYLRTRKSPEPSPLYLWYTEKLGFEIKSEYPTGDGRVILTRNLTGLPELLSE